MLSVKCGMWSVECGVWSVECGVWSVECGVWSIFSVLKTKASCKLLTLNRLNGVFIKTLPSKWCPYSIFMTTHDGLSSVH